MSNWLTRPAYVALIAFLAGGAIAVAVVLLVLLARGGDDNGNGGSKPRATSTVDSTPGVTPDVTQPPLATATPGAASADGALGAFISANLSAQYGGQCFPAQPAGQICSTDLYRGADLLTVDLAPTGGEPTMEGVVVHNPDGSWTATAFALPDPNVALAVGADAVIYHTETCLNFRAQPTTSSQPTTCQLDGTHARVEEGPTTADGITWWRLEGLGWASAEFLGVAR